MNRISVLFILLIFSYQYSLGQNGALDYSFNTFGNFNGPVGQTLVQPDGKIVVTGNYFSNYRNQKANKIIRLNEDGSIDNSFITGEGISGSADYAFRQPDGKILVTGQFNSYNTTVSDKKIIRLNSDGSLDNTFTSPYLTGSIYDVVIQSSGKIVIVGNFSYSQMIPGHPITYKTIRSIVRLNSNGSFDPTFAIDKGMVGTSSTVLSIIELPDGKLLLGGGFWDFNGTTVNDLVRLNADGSYDNSFSVQGPNNPIYDMELQSDGNILAGGDFTSYNGVSVKYLMRIDQNGNLLDALGNSLNNKVTHIRIQPDGKLLICGTFTKVGTTTAMNFARLEANGNIDNSFQLYNESQGGYKHTSLTSDGNILLAGSFTHYEKKVSPYLVKLSSNGVMVNSFTPPAGTNVAISTVKQLPNNQYLLATSQGYYSDKPVGGVVRINNDGSLDPSFNSGPGISNIFNSALVYDMELVDDNKIIAAGDFSSYNTNSANSFITRINPDGSPDNSFGPDDLDGLNWDIFEIEIQPDGKIIAGGKFTSYFDYTFGNNTISRNGIARLNKNGSIDLSFNPGTGANNWVHSLLLQPDGKIIIAGRFTSYNGNTVGYIARLNSDGSFDNTFNTGTGFNEIVSKIKFDKDYNILVFGSFTSFNGQSVTSLVRLKSDGSLDPSFDIGSGPKTGTYSGNIASFFVQEDNKVIISGEFDTFNGYAYNNVIRLLPDGTPDPSFVVNQRGVMVIYGIDNHNKILFGTPGSCENNTINGIGRLENEELVSSIKYVDFYNNQLNFTVKNPSQGELNISIDSAPEPNQLEKTIALFDLRGIKKFEASFQGKYFATDIHYLSKGMYLCVVTENDKRGVKKIIIE